METGDQPVRQLEAAVTEAKEKKLPAAELAKCEKALAAHVKAGVTVTKAQTLALGPARPTHVHIRGNFLRPGALVAPDTPAVLPPLTANGPRTRLDLARWLVRADNPLTPRVAVNWTAGSSSFDSSRLRLQRFALPSIWAR